MAYGLSNGHVTDDVTRPWKVKLVTPKLLELEPSNMVCSFVSGMPSGRTNNFPWKWAWLRSRDPTIFGIRSNVSLKLLELETSNSIHGFVWAMPSRRTNKFPWKWVCHRSHDPYNFLAVRSAILAIAWLLVSCTYAVIVINYRPFGWDQCFLILIILVCS